MHLSGKRVHCFQATLLATRDVQQTKTVWRGPSVREEQPAVSRNIIFKENKKKKPETLDKVKKSVCKEQKKKTRPYICYYDLFVVRCAWFNPFTAKVTNKRLLGGPPKLLFGTKSHKNECSFT
jgi:hypothetical protein